MSYDALLTTQITIKTKKPITTTSFGVVTTQSQFETFDAMAYVVEKQMSRLEMDRPASQVLFIHMRPCAIQQGDTVMYNNHTYRVESVMHVRGHHLEIEAVKSIHGGYE